MAFSNYADLRAGVIDQIGSDDVLHMFSRLTQMAEAYLSRNLRMREQIASTSLTISAGSASLPSDFEEAVGFYTANGRELVAQPPQDVKTTNSRAYYKITGTTLTTEAGDGAYTLEYYQSLPTLTTSATTTNWLLERFPHVYLYAVSMEAAKAVQNVEMGQAMAQMLADAVDEARASDNRARYSRARVRVSGVTP